MREISILFISIEILESAKSLFFLVVLLVVFVVVVVVVLKFIYFAVLALACVGSRVRV